MKAVATYQKLRGGYYTPEPIADFLTRWAIQSSHAQVLEPSCGDGSILLSAVQALASLNGAEGSPMGHVVHGVEIDAHEALKALQRFHDLDLPAIPAQVHVGDFFAFCKERLEKGHSFDAIVGNPPFIRYQNFLEEHRTLAFYLMQKAGLHPNRLTNAWVPFLVCATMLLKKSGRIAMVIPAELLQVDYAAELRLFLSNSYSKLTLITFKKLVFDGIQQEVVLLLGERNGDVHTGIRTVELADMEDLASYEHTAFARAELKPLDHSTEKWTRYFLDRDEIDLLRSVKQNPLLTISGNVIDVDVGIVTGLNEFFVVSGQQVQDHDLAPYAHRIVGRSAHLPGIIFRDKDWEANAESQYPSFLLRLPDEPIEKLPAAVRKYVLAGEERGINQGYKCRIRKRWYAVPSVWTPSAFMLRQVHGYPKIIINEANATCTDTIHRIKLLNGIGARTVAASFLNSLTFAFTEVVGRSYGGGVLELEPREAEKLPLPLQNADSLDLLQLNKMLLCSGIEEVLDVTDRVLLVQGLGLTSEEVRKLRQIWWKLRDRRMNRK